MSTKKPKAKSGKKKRIQLLYGGRRHPALSKRVFFVFVDEAGQEHFWRGPFRYLRLGHYYWADAEGDDISLPKMPEEVDREPLAGDHLDDLWARDAAAEAFIRRRRATSSLKSNNDLRRAIQNLARFYKGLGAIDDQAFATFIVDEIRRTKGRVKRIRP